MTPDDLALLIHAGATGVMAGLVLFVHVVHYPLIARVGPDEFVGFNREHQRRTTWVVAPAMLFELVSAWWIALGWARIGVPAWAAWAGIGLLGVVWLSTFAVQVPTHGRLLRGKDVGRVALLVRWNLPRTLAWGARFVLALWMLHAAWR
ncbi:MAG: hypothetical protein HRU70_05860 [Phycisphaeraceae bacterium]|nr:MAG: hypothetical protein HRU70_05860 [Phycisphaeraceae bacterium]